LREIPHSSPGTLVHRHSSDVHAVEDHLPVFGLDHSDGHAESSGLSRTVSPQQAYDLSLLHMEGYVVHHGTSGVAFYQVFGFEKYHQFWFRVSVDNLCKTPQPALARAGYARPTGLALLRWSDQASTIQPADGGALPAAVSITYSTYYNFARHYSGHRTPEGEILISAADRIASTS
jgi:hypothetical protein